MVLTAAADTRKVVGAPAAAMRNPAIEGAITRLLPKAMEISGTAERNSGRGSRRGKNAARAGSSMAADSPHQKCSQREVPQLRHAEHRRHADHDHCDRGIDLRDADELARIDAIGQHAAQQRQGELGHETAKMDKAQLRLRSRDLEGEPSQRERKHMLADNLRDQGQPVKAKVAHPQREEGIGFLFHRPITHFQCVNSGPPSP